MTNPITGSSPNIRNRTEGIDGRVPLATRKGESMKTFEFLLSEGCFTRFNIEAETEEQAKKIFEEKGLPDDLDREFNYCQLESIEEKVC